MIRRIAVLVAAASAVGFACPTAGATPSRPVVPRLSSVRSLSSTPRHYDTTNSRGGIVVKVPSRVTVYNKARARISPKVTVYRSALKDLRSRTLIVWSGKQRLRSGAVVRLAIGTYTVQTVVRYHAYKYVTKYRTVTTRTLHPGGSPDNTSCTVAAVSSSLNDGVNDTIETATCTNAAYPDQTVEASGTDLWDLQQRDDTTVYTVGQVVTTSGTVSFNDYYTTSSRQVPYKVKTYTRYGSYATPKHQLVVHDGGHQRIFTGIGDEYGSDFYSSYFTVPTHWRLGYGYDCSNSSIDSGNWILDLHRKGDPSYEDTNLNNDISSGDTAVWNLTGAGTFRIHVFTECIWAIIVRWK